MKSSLLRYISSQYFQLNNSRKREREREREIINKYTTSRSSASPWSDISKIFCPIVYYINRFVIVTNWNSWYQRHRCSNLSWNVLKFLVTVLSRKRKLQISTNIAASRKEKSSTAPVTKLQVIQVQVLLPRTSFEPKEQNISYRIPPFVFKLPLETGIIILWIL